MGTVRRQGSRGLNQRPQTGAISTDERKDPVVATTGPGNMTEMPAPPDTGGSVDSAPSGMDVRNESAPEIDSLTSQVESLRTRIQELKKRPTQAKLQQCQDESEQLRNRAEQAVQKAYRLGIARAVRAIRQSS